MERIINFANYTVKLNINKPGIYSISDDSGQGKSYLCKLLDMTKPDDIYAISSSDVDEILFKLKRFEEVGYKVLILDRFDLIKNDEIINIIKSLEDRFIILDYKNHLYDKDFKVSSAFFSYDGKKFDIYA